MRLFLLTAALACAILPARAQTSPPSALPPISGPQQPAPAPGPASMPGIEAGAAGRFQLHLVPAATAGSVAYAPFQILLDTQTGQTWMLPPIVPGQPPAWMPLHYLSSPAAPEASPRPR